MKRTRVSDLLGIDYPIIQGGMLWIANAELAAAVSNAGALGVISPTAGMAADGDPVANLAEQIIRTKNLTSKPFGVNLPILGNQSIDEMMALVMAQGVKIVVTAAGSPALHTGRLKEAGVKVMHLVASVKHAQSAQRACVDAVIAEGSEAGGHVGEDEVPTFVLVSQVVDAIRIPVIAAGGIADARGVVAALALGAEGVQMGTRFIATRECIAHQNFKQAIIRATDRDTAIVGRKIGARRVLKGEVTGRLLKMEAAGVPAEELRAFIGSSRYRKGQLEGDLFEGQALCGAVAGLIKEIKSAAEVVKAIVAEYDEIALSLRSSP